MIQFPLKKIIPLKKDQSENDSHTPLPFTWLIGSILFFFIATVVAPYFWSHLGRVDSNSRHSSLNIIWGISGILVYILEPLIWHNNIYGKPKEPGPDIEAGPQMNQQSWFSLISELVISLVLGLLIILPYVGLLIFKPVLRAMILFVSLGFLQAGNGNLGEYPLFVIPVTADIFLYYLDMIAPNWKYNPVRALAGAIKIRNRSAARFTGSVFLIIHTALIYSLLLTVIYYDFNQHPEKLRLKTLAGWWLLLTIYTRLSFITDDFDPVAVVKNMPVQTRVILVLGFAISFISFIWPFYFAG